MNSNIFLLRSSEDGLSVTTTSEGLFDEALIKPQEPSSKENRTPLTVKTSEIIWPSILVFSFYARLMTGSLLLQQVKVYLMKL